MDKTPEEERTSLEFPRDVIVMCVCEGRKDENIYIYIFS